MFLKKVGINTHIVYLILMITMQLKIVTMFQEENKGDEFQKKDSPGLDRKKELCRQ